MLTWTWTVTSSDTNANSSEHVTITVPLGAGEQITARLQYQELQIPVLSRLAGGYAISLGPDLQLFLGWLEPMAAILSLLLMFRWYGRGVNVRWLSLAVALLLPGLPLLVWVNVYWYGWDLPISTALLLACILLSGAYFRRALRSAPLHGHHPPLTGRSAGAASWLPLVSLVFVALLVASVAFVRVAVTPAEPSTLGAPDAAARALLTTLNILLALLLVWAVSALVLTFTRSSLKAISARTAPDGSLSNTGVIGTNVVHWYQLVAGVVIVVSAYAVGYDLANPIGQAFSAYRSGAASARWAAAQLAMEVGNIGVYPVLFLLLPVTATLIAATINATLSSSAVTIGVVATATLAWATTSRALDLDVVGTSLPVGAWILTAIVALSMRKALRDSVVGEAEPWLPGDEPLHAGSSSRASLRIRLGKWLAQTEPESPKDAPPPGNMVQRGPFRDAYARANLALAWATLLSVVPVAYLVWGTLTALPKNGSQPVDTSIVVSQAVSEIVRWTLTGWLYGLLLPVLPGRVGPVKALWLSGAWFAASAPVAIVDVWTGADPGRVWLFPGLQLLLFLTALAVLMDLSTVHIWAGEHLPLAANWSTLLKVYNLEDARKVALYAAPAIAAVIAIGQQVVSGTGLDFVNSLLSSAQSLLGGR